MINAGVWVPDTRELSLRSTPFFRQRYESGSPPAAFMEKVTRLPALRLCEFGCVATSGAPVTTAHVVATRSSSTMQPGGGFVRQPSIKARIPFALRSAPPVAVTVGAG